LTETKILLEHTILFESISKSNISFVYPKIPLVGPVAVGINYLSVPFEKRDSENDTNYESATLWMGAIQFSGSKKINEKLSLGLSVKYLQQDLNILQTNGIAFDLGGNLVIKGTNIGFVLQNLGLEFAENSDPLPVSLIIGGAERFFDNKLLITSDLKVLLVEQKFSIGIGAEYVLNKYFFPRVGYVYVEDTKDFVSGLNLGFGVEYKNFVFNYAFNPLENLGSVHRISLGYCFK
jgi:long-subunit fatty acid transport protein